VSDNGEKKSENIHMRKLFGGCMTAEEVHRSVALKDQKCPCGIQAAIKARTFATAVDLQEKDPLMLMALAQKHPDGMVPVTMFNFHGTPQKFIKLGEVVACEICTPALEKVLAKAPSWIHVEFDRGPGKDKPIIQVVK
jgi:hypothetical protein